MTAERSNLGHDRAFDLSPVNAIKCATFHIKAGNINWPMAIYITFAHVWACIGLTHLASVQWQTVLWTMVLWPISLLGIGAGCHRLWSHRSFDASAPVRGVLMLCNSIANQGSIFHWVKTYAQNPQP